MKALLYEYNPWWEGSYTHHLIPRPHLQQKLWQMVESKNIVFITGLRRVGKTSLAKNLIGTLLAQGTDPKHIFYISMDDFLLKDKTLIEILAEYRQLHKISLDTLITVFFDEIAAQANYPIQLKNLYDKQKIKIFASSSSSPTLSDQKGLLTGRARILEVMPLDFEEYLIFKNIEIKKKDLSLISTYFEDYLQTGGMPEYVLSSDREYLSSLIDDIINKDIIANHGIKQPSLIKDYFILLMERAGKQISLNKVAHILGISVDSAKRYLYMFEKAFLIYIVPRHGKINTTLLSPKKIYAADLGMRHLITGFRDKGAAFENYVFMKIKSLNPKYVYENSIEIDFLTENKILIEVKYGRTLEDKQQALFDKTNAKHKLVIQSIADLPRLEELLNNKT